MKRRLAARTSSGCAICRRSTTTPGPSAGPKGQLKAGGKQVVAWRVVSADFVTVDTGTGVVHQAPAFGEVDFDVLLAEQARFVEGQGPQLINAVAPDGTFTAEAPDYQGRWVKDCDRDIIRNLKSRGLLLHQEQYLHDYPFCWRAEEDPLIQYPRKSWFIRTTKFRDEMLANNRLIHWLPEHIRDGRFGNFLESNVDWALSRERYWGTPLPIWVCEATGYMEAVASYEELWRKPGATGFEVWEKAKAANPSLADHLRIHKPYIDAVTYDSPEAPGKRMRRVPDVIDCWFDSGAMPFAQWGYPHKEGSTERFRGQFPADFISEALDQTRGWFYSQLAISTLLFGRQPDSKPLAASQPSNTPGAAYPHPFRNCIVLGLMLGEDGQKMSKSKRNYREPREIFDRYGADALRWYFFSNQPPWTSIRYSEQAIKETIPEFLLRLWNVYSFFVIYANIDGFDPASEITGNAGQLTPDVLATGRTCRLPSERSELDRWILSELNRTAAGVVEQMDQYDNFNACGRLIEFVDALSNWYVRRSRDRFWSSVYDADKSDAYWTLYECLLTTAKLIAPMVPFLAKELWQNLAVAAFCGPVRPRFARRKRPSLRLSNRRRSPDRRCPLGPNGPGSRDRLAGPFGPHGRQAQGPPAAVRGRSHFGRSYASGLARRARAIDLRRIEREEGRFRRSGRPLHQLYGAARPETAWPAVGQAVAGRQEAACGGRRRRLAGRIEKSGQSCIPLGRRPGGPGLRRHPGSSPGQGRLGSGPRQGLRGRAFHRIERGPAARRNGPRGRTNGQRSPQGHELPVHRPRRDCDCHR